MVLRKYLKGEMEMAVLEKTLAEEYERIQRRMQQIDAELSELPKGYISEKKINDRIYYYLQRREKSKIVSEYVRADEIAQMRRMIAYRKELEGERKDVLKEFDKIRKVLGVYTEAEKRDVISAGVKAADEGRVISASESFEKFKRGISDAKRVQSSNNRTRAEMDR